MNTPLIHMAATTVVLTAGLAFAQDKPAEPAENVFDHSAVINMVVDPMNGDNHKSIEVMVTNDNGDENVRVIIDGKELDGHRIVRKDGRIIVLDADGNELQAIDQAFDIQFGVDGGKWMEHMDGIHGLMRDRGHNWIARPHEEPKVMIGVNLGTPSPALRKHLRLEAGATTMLNGVYEGLAAHNAGLDAYDIVTAINGEEPATPERIREALADLEPGDGVTLTVIHEGRKKAVTVYADAYDAAKLRGAKVIGEGGGNMTWSLNNALGNVIQLDRLPHVEDFEFIAPGKDGADVFIPDKLLRQRLHLQRQPPQGDAQPEQRLDEIGEQMQRLEKMMESLMKQSRDEDPEP